MSAPVIASILLILCLLIAGCAYWSKMKKSALLTTSFPFLKTKLRKLQKDELQAIEQYLNKLDSPSGSSHAPMPVAQHRLMPQGDCVYPLVHAITRYELTTDDPNKRRYYLDNIEVHLPVFWEQYIADDNQLEVIKTHSIPLVISINGHSLVDAAHEDLLPPPDSTSSASIRQTESEKVELQGVRKETQLEYQLSQQGGIRESIVIVVALLMLYASLMSPNALMPWLLTVATGLIAWGIWRLYSRPSERDLKEIHCIRGIPKRWGLFGESNVGQINNVSLGTLDLIYPAHWQNYIQKDLGHKTDIEMYLSRHVVRQGRFLSLHDEVKNFPLQRWGRNIVLLGGALLTLTLLLTTQPLSIPFKLSSAWLHGTHSVDVNSVKSLAALPLHVGDTLNIQGTGMCRVPASYQDGVRYPFMPFDCSAIYWSNATPMSAPASDIVDNAAALLATVNRQLNANNEDQKVNPGLASAIQKSGMILLDDFADIVLRTEDLCAQQSECTRLKNSLVNLGNSKSWSALLKKAQNGGLDGVNVLLRPASAQLLSNIVNSAVSSFYYRETHQAAQSLTATPPGGFLIISDEGKQLVNHPQPAISLYDYTAIDQWRELESLSQQLLATPFKASGVITELSTDANGTRHIMLHSEPDGLTLWRYILTCALLLAVTLIIIVNALMFMFRIQKSMNRIPEIQRYYDQCINHNIMPFDTAPRR